MLPLAPPGTEPDRDPDRSIYMPQDRYVAALKRQRGRIEAGLEPFARDSDALGDKETVASWGLCSNEPEAWPHEQDHLWPDQFLLSLRVAPKYRTRGQRCPFDDVSLDRHGRSPDGCFYRCRIFQTGRTVPGRPPAPGREEAIKLYDDAMSEAGD